MGFLSSKSDNSSVMLRPCARACLTSRRTFTSNNLPVLLSEVRALATRGQLNEALTLLYTLPPPHSTQTYATLFHACARHQSLHQGLSLHRYMLSHCPTTTPPDLFVSNHLINMYAKLGYLDHAHHLFDQMPTRNHVTWTALISGYAQLGRAQPCFRLFADMLGYHFPNEFAFASVLSSCGEGDGGYGRQVHAVGLKMCLDGCAYVANALITMYSKVCGHEGRVYDASKDEAMKVYRSMESRNLVSWNSMIAGFQYRRLGAQAIDLFVQVHNGGLEFDHATLLSVLSSLSEVHGLDDVVVTRFCFQLHCLVIKTGFILGIEVVTALVKAYSDLGGDVADCYWLFSETSRRRDIVVWTGVMTILSQWDPEEVLSLFRQLRRENLAPDMMQAR